MILRHLLWLFYGILIPQHSHSSKYTSHHPGVWRVGSITGGSTALEMGQVLCITGYHRTSLAVASDNEQS